MKKILYIGNKLSQHGFNKTTIETLGGHLTHEGYTVETVSNKKKFTFRLFEMLWSILTSNHVDFILIDTYSTKAFWYAFICSQIARIRKINYIPILHGGDLPKRLSKNPKLCKKIFSNAYKNVAPSGYLKDVFEKAGFDNVIYIPNSIELKKYQFKERNKIEPKLLWVRAFAAIYNPTMAVDVLVKIKEIYPNASLTMVGPDKDGSMQTTKKYAEINKVEINFTGKLSKEEWWALAAEHDIFMNTTNFDNTPVSIMEAMALGLPVVTTNVGGIPFLLEDKKTALLIEKGDVNAMSRAVIELLQNETLTAAISLNARVKTESWDWEVIKKHWNKLLLSNY